jgi:CheY-like chemotaxis protein
MPGSTASNVPLQFSPFLLVVEDNPYDIELKQLMFKRNRFPHPVNFVRDGAEALDFLMCRGVYQDRPNINPSLMMLDFRLPKLDGVQVLTRMSAVPRLRSIPVVMVVSTQEDHVKLAQSGLRIFGYLMKPVQYTKFAELLEHVDVFRRYTDSSGTRAPVFL